MDNNQPIYPSGTNNGQGVSTPTSQQRQLMSALQTPTSFGSVYPIIDQIYPSPDIQRHFNSPSFMNQLMQSQNVSTVHTAPFGPQQQQIQQFNPNVAQNFVASTLRQNVLANPSNVQLHEHRQSNEQISPVETLINNDDGLDEHGLPIVDVDMEQRLEDARQEGLSLKKKLGLDSWT